MISHGDVVWVDFGSPRGSEPAKRRPAVVVQEDDCCHTDRDRSRRALTSNLAIEAFPGNVLVPVDASGLDKDSVAVVSQVGPVSREFLEPYPVDTFPAMSLSKIADGIRLVMGI